MHENMQPKLLWQFSYRCLRRTVKKKKAEDKISLAILVWWKIAWCVKYVYEFSLSYLGPHTQPLVVLLPFSFSLKKYFNTWHFCCLATETRGNFWTPQCARQREFLKYLQSSSHFIATVCPSQKDFRSQLQQSESRKRKEVKAWTLGLKHINVLVGLNPIFPLVLIQPHLHNVPFTPALSRGMFWIWIFTRVCRLQ